MLIWRSWSGHRLLYTSFFIVHAQYIYTVQQLIWRSWSGHWLLYTSISMVHAQYIYTVQQLLHRSCCAAVARCALWTHYNSEADQDESGRWKNHPKWSLKKSSKMAPSHIQPWLLCIPGKKTTQSHINHTSKWIVVSDTGRQMGDFLFLYENNARRLRGEGNTIR